MSADNRPSLNPEPANYDAVVGVYLRRIGALDWSWAVEWVEKDLWHGFGTGGRCWTRRRAEANIIRLCLEHAPLCNSPVVSNTRPSAATDLRRCP